jgi:futalosine hydrolase
MNIAIVAATPMELDYVKDVVCNTQHQLHFEFHGVGIMNTVYCLTKLTQLQPSMIIQCVITGVEDHQKFLDLFDLQFEQSDSFPFVNGRLFNNLRSALPSITWVDSLTVNTASGSEDTISKRVQKYHPDIETMEGAALHYVCLQEGIPFLQLRGISNKVEPRNKANWKIEEAMKSCRHLLTYCLQQFPQ